MSDTTVRDCIICREEGDCIEGICSNCAAEDDLSHYMSATSRLSKKVNELEAENRKLKGQLDNTDIEQISEAIHRAYCEQYKKKHNKEYWTKGDYSLLDEETKEFDRATLRAVLQALKA